MSKKKLSSKKSNKTSFKVKNIASLCSFEQLPEVVYSGNDLFEQRYVLLDSINFSSNQSEPYSMMELKTGVFLKGITEGYHVKLNLSERLLCSGFVHLNVNEQFVEGEIVCRLGHSSSNHFFMKQGDVIGTIVVEKTKEFCVTKE